MNTALQIKAYAPIARRSWTVQEDTKLIKLLSKTNDYNYAAASLGRTYSSITHPAKALAKKFSNISYTVII